MNEYLCRCNNCGSIMYDENPQTESLIYNVDSVKKGFEIIHMKNLQCPVCETDGYLDDNPFIPCNEIADKLWEMLGDIPIDDKERIDENFLHFSKGTDMYEIWHWFEDYFDISIGDRYFN